MIYTGKSSADPDTRAVPDLIPTEYKAKIPKTHSFPVGAELISEALADVPQFESLSICFSGMWTLREEQIELPIIEAAYRNIPISRFSAKELDRLHGTRWEIKVFPVPRESKGRIRSLLIGEGLAMVAKWLGTKVVSPHHTGRMSFTVVFDPKIETLRFLSRDEMGRS